MVVLEKARILELPHGIDLLPLIEEGFVADSEGRVVVPPVGEMVYDDPPGDVHIKYGYSRGDDCYVVKIASGFHDNPALGLPSGNGMILLFDQRTGAPQAVLMDAEELTPAGYSVETTESAAELAAPCNLIAGEVPGRMSPEQITGADLTGVAEQDLEIVKAVFGAAGGTAPVVGG
jgi:ornithine cyclodeaminase/alanine dehydrogenase-like protein (mu-crystallin family)